ncbi:MAG: hypothetical protein ACRDT4_25870 [Micromonosporaceae bacterium]
MFGNATTDSTDILHEYFVPQSALWEFVRPAKAIIRDGGANLLNVTVRDVRRDGVTALPYARHDVFGLVMLFVQERTVAGEQRMRRMTRALVDAAIAAGGSFYLPYRLHATADQLQRAYPSWDKVVAEQRRRDPDGVFRNGLYNRYAHP